MHPAAVVLFTSLALFSSVTLGVVSFVIGAHLRYRRLRNAPAAYAGKALLFYWFLEIRAIFAIFWWSVRALRSNGLRGPVGKRPVLCVHGFVGNGSHWWGLRREIHHRGRPTLACNLGPPGRTIERYAPALVEAIYDAAARSPDGKTDIVAHSMGGLVLRFVAQDPELRAMIGRVVTLGSPHAGTQSVPTFMRDEVEQMRPGSEFLQSLLAPGDEDGWQTVAARQDYVVFPEESATLPGVEHQILERTGHAGLLVHGFCHDVICRSLGV